MKALSLQAVGKLVLEERQRPVPGEREVLVRIRACGICSSDKARIFETGTYHFPTVPGHEFAGQIVEAGKGCSSGLIGRRASIFPMLPCMKCPSCLKQEYATCSNYKYFGSRNDGGFEEYLAVPEWNLNLLDDSVDYRIGALSEPAAVSYHAVSIGDVKKGDQVVVIGTGAIGLLIGYFAQLRGGHVYICGRNEEKLQFARELGFDTLHSESLPEDAARITGGQRMNVVFEAVGNNRAMETAILSATPGGTVVAVGNPEGDFHLPKDVYWKILRWQLNVRGTWNSSFSDRQNDWKAVAELMKRKDFPFEKLITREYRLEESEKAMEDLRSNMAIARLMFVMDGEE